MSHPDPQAVAAFLEKSIRPRVQADGGEIRFVSYEDGLLTVRMQGECSRCPIATGGFRDYCLAELRRAFGPDLRLKQIVDRPYFWDRTA